MPWEKLLAIKKPIVLIFVELIIQSGPKMTQDSHYPIQIQLSENGFLIEKWDNLKEDNKMYMSEVSKFQIADIKAQKIITLRTLQHVSAISKHPVL